MKKKKEMYKEYTNALLIVEELIDKVNESTPENNPDMKRFIEASDKVEAYEEMHYEIFD